MASTLMRKRSAAKPRRRALRELPRARPVRYRPGGAARRRRLPRRVNDQTLNDLFERTRISMPGDQPGSLDRQQVADVLALVLAKNAFPAGQSELPITADALNAIKIFAKTP